MDPFALLQWPLYWIRWWQKRVGMWGVVAMLALGVVLAVILNYTT
jgi:hypothetical protein